MSRIGKLPISIPESVNVNYNDTEIIVQGKFGTLNLTLPDVIDLSENNKQLKVGLKNETKKVRALHGLYRTLISNMILGVSEQFDLTLVLKGVGYRAVVEGKEIVLSLGYSHPVKIEIPKEISVEII
jgi:large subunit ribosomal protein L6